MAATANTVPTAKVLVLGNYRQTITVIRSLARAGHPIVVGRCGARSSTELSRYTSEVWAHPDPADEERFVQAVLEVLDARSDIRYVFPVSEVEIRPLASRHAELAARAVVVQPAPPALDVCLDKARTCAVAAELGVPLPATRILTGATAVDAAAADLGFPLVVKRPDSILIAGGRKALICRDRRDLEDQRDALARERGTLLLQSWVPGLRHNCQFAARQGEIVAFFQQKVLRTDERDGTGLTVDGVSVPPAPALRSHCEALVRRLSYTGVGCIQFLVAEPSGVAALLEWNPRLDANCDLPYRCGFDFPLLALRLAEAQGAAAPARLRVPASYPLGKKIYWPEGDLKALGRRLRDGDIGAAEISRRAVRMLASPLRRECRLGWSWSDPLPTMFMGWRAAGRLLRRARPRARAAARARMTGVTS